MEQWTEMKEGIQRLLKGKQDKQVTDWHSRDPSKITGFTCLATQPRAKPNIRAMTGLFPAHDD